MSGDTLCCSAVCSSCKFSVCLLGGVWSVPHKGAQTVVSFGLAAMHQHGILVGACSTLLCTWCSAGWLVFMRCVRKGLMHMLGGWRQGPW
jgi:hypothetical protein